MFQNDDAYIDYMGLREHLPKGDHKAGFAIKLNTVAYFGEGAKPSSRKNIKIKKGSEGENHRAAVSDHKTVKRKDVSEGENPTVAPDDGMLDTLPSDMYQERSQIVVEPIEPVNIGTEEQPKIIHFAKSLTPPEKTRFVPFFKKKRSYADMPGLDPNLILHHLPLDPGVKLVKQKLRKMHPHIALLVKEELKKLLDVGFIRAIDYPEWISNIVPVSKPDGRV